MLKAFIKLAILSTTLVPCVAFAGELGVSHSVSNSVRSGVGNLTVNSVKNIQTNEESISITGQLSGAQFQYGEGSFSKTTGSPIMQDGPDNDNGKGNDKEKGRSLAIGGALGSGGLGQLSASLASRTLSSNEIIKSDLTEHYSFSDSVFTQTSSTFSR